MVVLLFLLTFFHSSEELSSVFNLFILLMEQKGKKIRWNRQILSD